MHYKHFPNNEAKIGNVNALKNAILISPNNSDKTSFFRVIETVRDIMLLDCQTLFRKEQIWFTHKDCENAYLYSLADFTAEKTGV